jgi:hypothetical protein
MNFVNSVLCALSLFVSHFDSFGPFGDSRFFVEKSRRRKRRRRRRRRKAVPNGSLFSSFALYLLDRETTMQ